MSAFGANFIIFCCFERIHFFIQISFPKTVIEATIDTLPPTVQHQYYL